MNNAAQVVDALADAGGWIDSPDEFHSRWRVHEPAGGLAPDLRDAIRAQWADVQREAERRQADALEAARAKARSHLPRNPTPADRERAIDAGCVALLREVLSRGVGVPELPADQLIEQPRAESGALFEGNER